VAPSGSQAQPPKPAEVQVKISALPTDAKIYIDEVQFPNPMDAWRPRSLDPVRIRVQKRGYRSIEQVAIFDQDRTLSFELMKGKGVTRLPATTGAGQAGKQTGQSTSGATSAPSSQAELKGNATPAPRPDRKPTRSVSPTGDRSTRPRERTPTAPGGDDIYRGPSGEIRDRF
jgi:hypothetical protein